MSDGRPRSGPHGAENGIASALGAMQQPGEHIPVQYVIEIALDTNGGIHTQVNPPNALISRPILNMLITTAHQDLLSRLAAAERAAAQSRGPKIAIAPPGSDAERNPKA